MNKVVVFDSQNVKELLEKGDHLIIDDSLPEEELRYIAKIAAKEEKMLTIVASKWHLEALKRVANDGKGMNGKGYVKIGIREAKKRK